MGSASIHGVKVAVECHRVAFLLSKGVSPRAGSSLALSGRVTPDWVTSVPVASLPGPVDRFSTARVFRAA